MLDYTAPAHGLLTYFLMVLHLVLAVRFFRSSRDEATTLDRVLVQVVRYALLLVFISGLVLNITLSQLVSQVHQIISIIPAVIVVGAKCLPHITHKPCRRSDAIDSC